MIRAYDAETVRAAEAPLLEAGVPLMREAARALANRTVRELERLGARVPGSVVLALVGGGNNGGDALYAAADLARRGVQVHAALCSNTVHEEGLAAARAAGVRVTRVVSAGRDADLDAVIDLARRSGVWLDGLAGIGLSGPLRDPLSGIVAALAEERAVSPDEPVVIAIDVPSGVGDDGAVRGPILPADVTVTMGVAKPGLLLPPTALHAGEIQVVELGLPVAELKYRAGRLGAADVADLYAWPEQDDHKYTRGVVGIWAGSARFPGAAILCTAGALATGPGMVRYLGQVEGVPLVHPEVVTADGQIQAAVVGSGIDPTSIARPALDAAFARGVPVVVDAGALADLPAAIAMRANPAPVVITPHAGELATMLGVSRRDVERHPARRAHEVAEKLGVIVLLKGPTTIVVPPEGPIYSQADSTPWLATAGTGDVLAGVAGTLIALAQARAEDEGDTLRELEVARLAAAASWLHGQAGRRASTVRVRTAAGKRRVGSGPIRARDVAAAVPAVLSGLSG